MSKRKMIYLDDAIDVINDLPNCPNGYSDAYDKASIISALGEVPSAQPERKKGEWLPQDHNKRAGYVTTTVYYYPKCSECGHTGNYGMNYCPSCGADMRGEQDE